MEAGSTRNLGEPESPDAIEKLLSDSALSAREVYDFFNSSYKKLDEFGSGRVDDWKLQFYKPQNAREAYIIDFLRKARPELASINDDDVLYDRHISLKDMEQFRIRYDGSYNRNLERLAELKRLFSASLPELDKNGDGLLTKPELSDSLVNPKVSESTRNYAAFLDSEFSRFSFSAGRTKRIAGIEAIGQKSFEREISQFDFEKSRTTATAAALGLIGISTPIWATPIFVVALCASTPVLTAIGGLTLLGAGLGYSWMRRNAITSHSDKRMDTLTMLQSAEQRGVFSKR